MASKPVRPHYEEASDLDVELEIATTWGKRTNSVPAKLPNGPRYSIDFAFMRGNQVAAVAEIKNRPTWKYQYGNVILGLSKVKELWTYERMGIPAFFVVQLYDGIHHWRVTQCVTEVQWAGRTDRGDAQDTEPCVTIPIRGFTPCIQPQ